MQKLDAGILGRELPVHGFAQGVAVVHPGLDLGSQHGLAFDAPVQALRGQGRELDFGDVEPAAVLGRVVPLQPGGDAPRFGRSKGLVEHAGVVRVEVVADQDHLLGQREVHVHQIAQDGGKVQLGASRRDLDRAPALLGCGDQEQVAHPLAPVLASPPARVGSLPADLEAYLALFAPLYQRREQVASARRYLLGLLSDEPRKSVARMVLKLQGPDRNAVRSLQQFVGESSWSDAPLLECLWSEVGAILGEEEGVLIVDGSDFRKQGRMSVGGAASGAGSWASGPTAKPGSSWPMPARRGPAWCAGQAPCPVPGPRTRTGRICVAVAGCRPRLRSGPRRNGRPPCWVTCDEAYGQDPAFLDAVADLGLGDCADNPAPAGGWCRPCWPIAGSATGPLPAPTTVAVACRLDFSLQ